MIFNVFTPILRLMMDDFQYLFRIHSAIPSTTLRAAANSRQASLKTSLDFVFLLPEAKKVVPL